MGSGRIAVYPLRYPRIRSALFRCRTCRLSRVILPCRRAINRVVPSLCADQYRPPFASVHGKIDGPPDEPGDERRLVPAIPCLIRPECTDEGRFRARETCASPLGLHAIPLKGGVGHPADAERPVVAALAEPAREGEVYVYLRQRIVNRIKAVRASRWLFASDLAMAATAILLASLVRLDIDGQAPAAERFEMLLGVMPWFVLTSALIFPFHLPLPANWRYMPPWATSWGRPGRGRGHARLRLRPVSWGVNSTTCRARS